ncbi:hypothetical protein M409DRAFT_19890 [Zasmidium cellare ATCC 36951]|uniref:Methyltransferase domain-containing protein n=1 Tax=Zasmidium cellare ATCC 36951 TaxID=1080233 RepID=A0A6A6CVQ9_ZASCE|nr:uncharacterized protein M409DRAFT_19890 [Zasmidium cellare ATCC 36951]KAF2170288.1 hypothetical protein M409DRAFT_19890 [Zasmidium cellare ATCC 36951]
MANSTNDIYVLPRDTKETQRLNEQHKHLLKCFPFLIHPATSVDAETPDLRIADIACGSGIWLTDVAQHYPKAECHGFDISGDQFLDEGSLDKLFGSGRVRFHVEDAASESGPLPEHRGKFDVVAVRLIHSSLVGEAWNRAVRNIMAMLKPGGHVQWIDWDPQRAYIVQYKPLAKKAAMEQLVSALKQFFATRDSAVAERLDELFSEHGMVDVLAEKHCSDPDLETRDFISWTVLNSVPGMVRKSLLSREGSGWTEERLAKIEQQAKEEQAAGEAFLRFDMTCYVAKKPE